MPTVSNILQVAGIIMVVYVLALTAIRLGRLWPYRPRKSSDPSVETLGQILAEVHAQTLLMRTPDTEQGVQTGMLLELRNSLNDMRVAVEQDTKARMDAAAPTLDALRQINEHLFADVASRAQMDELIEISRNYTAPSGPKKPAEVDLAMLAAMDTLVDGFEKFRKQQASFLNAIFNSGSIATVADEDASKLEEIEALMRRYGLDREAATERVERKRVYEPSGGRGRMQAGV